ncbi:MAG: AAA family ATPase [Woeseiaceae bacterium]
MKVLVTGASGSGTTTLANSIAKRLKVAALDMDDFYWFADIPPFQRKRDPGDRLRAVLAALAKHSDVIVSGSILGWGLALEDCFDLIVSLYLDASIRVERLRKREQQRLGKVDPAFLAWAAAYDESPSEGRSLAKHTHWLSERSCPVLRLNGDLTIEARRNEVVAAMNAIDTRSMTDW